MIPTALRHPLAGAAFCALSALHPAAHATAD